MAPTRYGPRCVIKDKHSYGSYNVAARISRKWGLEGDPYRCGYCGWYHVTGMKREEASRHRARRNWEIWSERNEWSELRRAG